MWNTGHALVINAAIDGMHVDMWICFESVRRGEAEGRVRPHSWNYEPHNEKVTHRKKLIVLL
jgi:hypothetical protein